MEWPLSELAKSCVDYAAGLDIFLENTAREHSIRDSIEELINLSKVLFALHQGLGHARYGRNISLIRHDLDAVVRSLKYTFDDVKKMFADTRFTHSDGSVPYRSLWEGMNHQLTKNEGINLHGRLERYNKFLEGLIDALKGQPPLPAMIVLRDRLTRLLKQQVPLEPLSQGFPFDQRTRPARSATPSMPKGPMFRPPLNHFPTYPAPGMTPPPYDKPGPARMPPHSPASTGSLNSWDWVPPYAPDAPQSPVYSDSSQHTWGSNSSNELTHWAPRLLTMRPPKTAFRSVSQPTRCDAREDPTAPQRLLKDGFVEVFRCSFPDAKANVGLLWRKDDHRSRILYSSRDSRTHRLSFYCMPMVSLKLNRLDNCLQLFRFDMQSKQMQRWANLHFTDYEQMTLFQCTYRAMKHQDSKEFPEQLLDYTQRLEEMEFAAEIRDDNFRHTLRIIRDLDSGCVRLEASARRGEMKGVPIWTAFVTDFIGSRTWMRLIGPNTVQLSQLRPYIFCNNYTPSGQSNSGVFQLKFTLAKDAAHFMHTFHQIY